MESLCSLLMMNKSEHSYFIKYDELTSEAYIDQLGKDLVRLAITPGPTRCVARIADNDPRIDRTERFPMTLVVQEILERLSRDNKIDLVLTEFNGNLLIVGALGINPTKQEIYDLPVTLAPHLDEITYMVKNERDKATGAQILIPLCNAPDNIKPENSKAKILGFRGENHRKLVDVGSGNFEPKPKVLKKRYLLNTEAKDLLMGDLVIQDYSHEKPDARYDLESIIHMKALDDRAGCIAQIYAVAELAKRGLPAKAILAGDEEGFNKDISWARLVRPAFTEFSRRDGLIIVCDGFDAPKMKEEFYSRHEHLSEALMTAYVSDASGAGDPGIFSLFRDRIVDIARRSGFEATITTSYASRSIDPKIMDEFPLIGFINWSNGNVWDYESTCYCHRDESVKLRQIANIIGTTCLVVNYFSEIFQ